LHINRLRTQDIMSRKNAFLYCGLYWSKLCLPLPACLHSLASARWFELMHACKYMYSSFGLLCFRHSLVVEKVLLFGQSSTALGQSWCSFELKWLNVKIITGLEEFKLFSETAEDTLKYLYNFKTYLLKLRQELFDSNCVTKSLSSISAINVTNNLSISVCQWIIIVSLVKILQHHISWRYSFHKRQPASYTSNTARREDNYLTSLWSCIIIQYIVLIRTWHCVMFFDILKTEVTCWLSFNSIRQAIVFFLTCLTCKLSFFDVHFCLRSFSQVKKISACVHIRTFFRIQESFSVKRNAHNLWVYTKFRRHTFSFKFQELTLSFGILWRPLLKQIWKWNLHMFTIAQRCIRVICLQTASMCRRFSLVLIEDISM
jgi:hypothetical protein